MNKVKQCIKSISTTYTQAQEENNKLSQELSNKDRQIQDILHEIEFNNFSAFQGYQYAKKLKELGTDRRKVKNEMAQLQIYLSMTLDYLHKAEDRIAKKEQQQAAWTTYTPKFIEK
jgi:chromosome segregation ATPase